jgi:hypothetical protein
MLTCAVPDLPIEETWKDTVVLHTASAGIAWITAIAASQEDDHDPDNNTGFTSVFVEAEKSAFTASASGGGGSSGVILPILLLLFLARRRVDKNFPELTP